MGNPVKTRKGALIGCGFFSKNHLHAWQQLEGVEIVALCDANAQRLQEASTEFGITKVYASAEDLLAREALDFVDIATTAASHRSLVEMAARHGVPCICQKPFANTLDDAVAMIQACRKAGVPLMVHENFRWQSSIQAVRKALDEDHIGQPFWGRVSFRSAYDVFSGQPYLATEDRFILQDLGIHIIDIARFLFGEVATMSASATRINPKIRGEDVATLLMKHTSGLTSVVDCSYATANTRELFPQTLIEIDGALGTLRLGADYQLTIHVKGGATQVVDCAPPLHDWAQRPWHNIQDSVLNIQAHWLQCLTDAREPQTSGVDNLNTLVLVEKAYESAAHQQTTIDIQKATPPC
ncbi:oxidoreductase [Hydrogenophaga crassostreae]|uniref:Oxidoreductase n=1 Tax=Hydrogenophaga crassostreae TaxID=1763535 RepID=A0A167IN32_9BURK|nr:Gfo/Idh/MocA family oxidoreductase [Hydrogenophaga crassostreae]AOW14682.1 oxidoreductase [Hydrogenophaga crassostreae]OAD43221.1 oxidoreductase [Hydrogenophaga crassostreae]